MYSLADRMFIHGLKAFLEKNVGKELAKRLDARTFPYARAQGTPEENVKQSWRSGSTLQGAKKECQNEFKVSDAILQQLNHFNLPPPLSDRDITHAGEAKHEVQNTVDALKTKSKDKQK
ncbi:hypothetical protein N7455_009696 [Penicillium solitum]|uniref:uncharacterized protein n=1 Tax=Penicillium solitum TaxID=60172 RepID=UPI0032C42B7E|nr:hypothetical protein N7455_009696 [Penicillium solitum]